MWASNVSEQFGVVKARTQRALCDDNSELFALFLRNSRFSSAITSTPRQKQKRGMIRCTQSLILACSDPAQSMIHVG
jgi:hypothetical protein